MYCMVNTFRAGRNDIGEVVSCHRTLSAAKKRRVRYRKTVKRRYGGKDAAAPMVLVQCERRVRSSDWLYKGDPDCWHVG